MCWTVGRKLGVGFASVVAITVVVAIVVLIGIQKVTMTQNRVLDERQPTVVAATNILCNINDSLASLRGYMILGGQKMKDTRAKAWVALDENMSQIKEFSTTWTDQQQIDTFAELGVVLGQFRIAQNQVEEVCQSIDNLPANKILLQDAAPKANGMLQAVTAMIDEEKMLEATSDRKALLANLADTRGSLAVGLASIRAYLLSGDKNFANTFDAKWKINTARLAALRESADLFTESQMKWFNEYQEHRKVFAPMPTKMLSIRGSTGWNISNQLLAKEAAPRGGRAKELIAELLQGQTALATVDTTSLTSQSSTLKTIVMVLTIIGVIVGIAVAWFITRGIVRPLNQTVEVLEKVAEGDLSQRLQIESKDELGCMALSLNTAVKASAKTLEQIKEAAEREQQIQAERAEEERRQNAAKRKREVEEAQREREAQEEKAAQEHRLAEEEKQRAAKEVQREREQAEREKQEQAARAEAARKRAEADREAAARLQHKVDLLLQVVATAAEGDLTAKVIVEGDEPVDELAAGIAKMLEDIAGVIGDVTESAMQFTESSRMIASTSQGLANGAQTQAASVEEMSASIEQLARSVESVTQSAENADQQARETNRVAQEGGDAVRKSIEAMTQIKASSGQISGIIQVISEIAKQTNLLALNAAIEAARAGEHGLGFAVVADEVRKLAERSNSAAEEITTLIRGSMQQVEDGAKLSEQTGTALSEIISGVEQTAKTIATIATATSEQSQNATEVATAIQSVAEVTEQSAASSEEMASSSEELGAQADSLDGLVRRFKVQSSKEDRPLLGHGKNADTDSWTTPAKTSDLHRSTASAKKTERHKPTLCNSFEKSNL